MKRFTTEVGWRGLRSDPAKSDAAQPRSFDKKNVSVYLSLRHGWPSDVRFIRREPF